ncbi:MAG: hypothetical protein K9N23_01715 [Akkermansiaceae bacterium]|nr:hypothetical protein [Akkermansiaceae bacterium]
MMVKIYGLAGASVLMLVQLLMLQAGNGFRFISRFSPDYPQVQLPIAEKSRRYEWFYAPAQFSWTRRAGWVITDAGAVKDEEVESQLRQIVERARGKGRVSVVRLRMPADASAEHFMTMARRAERVGVETLVVAVFQPPVRRSPEPASSQAGG